MTNRAIQTIKKLENGFTIEQFHWGIKGKHKKHTKKELKDTEFSVYLTTSQYNYIFEQAELEMEGNMSAYVRNLIREDMKKNALSGN